MSEAPILVTGSAGSIGAVGRTVVERLRAMRLPVRAFVHWEDGRSAALRATGAEVVAATSRMPRTWRRRWTGAAVSTSE